MDASPDAEPGRRLRRFVTILAALALATGGLHVVLGAREGRAAELAGGIAIAVSSVLALPVLRLLARGRAADAARLIAIVLLVAPPALAPLIPFVWPALAIVPLAAALIAMPWIDRRRTQLVAAVALLSCGVAVASGLFSAAAAPSHPVSVGLLVFGVPASAFLVLSLATGHAADTALHLDERNRALADLQAREERFRALAAATSQVIWTADPDGNISRDLPSWRELTGQHPDDTTGLGMLAVIHDADRPRVRRLWMRAVLARRFFEAEFRVRKRDGRWIDVVSRATPVFDRAGKLREWVGSLTDVTEAKDAQRRLEEESRRKDEFLAMLGHELRNPLAPIITSLQLLTLKGRGGDREIEVIGRQVRHVARLVDDLLDVSRINRGKIELKREPTDLALVVARAAEISRPLIDDRKQPLSVRCDRNLIVDGDPVRLAQVVANLLNNASKYSDAGRGIEVVARRDGARAVIEVADHGQGMPPDLVGSVFELFVQGTRTLDRAQGGLGVGLTVVRRLVEMHGGTVTAQSDGVGKGSTFRIRLPLVKAKPAVASGATARRAASPQRILVVDDNRDAVQTLAEALALAGHDVRVATDGESGLAAAREFLPETVLLDLGLPGLTGYEVARSIRREPRLAGARLIALTGYGQESDRRASVEAGFDAHLVKPVDFDAISAALGLPSQRHARG